MAASDRERWNHKHASRGAPHIDPDPFVEAMASDLAPGTVIDLAAGSGRHGLWLAARGHAVTLADISDVGLAQAARRAASLGLDVRCTEVDLGVDQPLERFDAAVCVHFLSRPLLGRVHRLLRPGGHFVFVHPTRLNLERHPSPSARWLLEPGEVASLLAGLELRHLEEGWSSLTDRHEARVVATLPG